MVRVPSFNTSIQVPLSERTYPMNLPPELSVIVSAGSHGCRISCA